MNAYLLLTKTDEATDAALSELTRFSVRTAGCFAAYAAVSFNTIEELRDVTEKLGAVSPGRIEVLVAVQASAETTETRSLIGVPPRCIDPETGQVDWSCLGSPEPSLGPKASYFAVAELQVEHGGRDAVHERLAASGGVTAVTRLSDPDRLLVELGATDRDLLMSAVEGMASLPGVEQVRTGLAVRPLELASVESA
ncbi:MAG TPA: hypothetical protein VNA12_00100 [Mycobacteriales bacterium]|nr:hypothetical protein [Mycobacteriales bacterium]